MARLQVMSRVETGSTPHWGAALWAGLAAASSFLVLEMVTVPLFLGESPWGPVRMIAAIALGRGVLPEPGLAATFDLGVLLAAALIHFALGILYGFIGSYLLFRLETGPAVVVGALGGLLLYWINFYGFTEVFPWFAMARNWVSIVNHIVFGMVLAWTYKGVTRRRIAHEPGTSA